MTYIGLSKATYILANNHLASGGEGSVYRVNGGTGKKVAKIYHANNLSQELENKLKYMMNNPPNQKILDQVAWPLDVLYNVNSKFCGFVMPELNINAELADIYKYPPDTDALSVKQKVIIAENICAVISAVHSVGYVFGDFNPRNIGVDKNNCMVAFLDTDTYHFFDNAKNENYRCKVCAPGYVAPELLKACDDYKALYPIDSRRLYEKTPLPTFTKETDNFALAIHIFRLLMNGYTPFSGIPEKTTVSQPSPGQGNVAIRRNEYSFRPGYKPMATAVPPLDIFPQEIAALFSRAFLVVGSINPLQRPTSLEWHQTLTRYETALIPCSRNKLHQYDKKNKLCPFCEADIRYQQAISNEQPIQQKTYSPTNTPVQPPFTSNPSQKMYSHVNVPVQPLSTSNPPQQKTKSWFWIIVIVVSLSLIFLVLGKTDPTNGNAHSRPVSTDTRQPESQPQTLLPPHPFPLNGTTWVFDDKDGTKHMVKYGKNNMVYLFFDRNGSLEQKITGTYTLQGNILIEVYEGSEGVTITKTYTQTQIIDDGYIYMPQHENQHKMD
jgi:serine/threonine protein kinase